MNKFYSLVCCLMMGISAMAQVDDTFAFTDANGNVVADGSTLTVKNFETDFSGKNQFSSGLWVKNTSEANAFASMTIDITQLDNGELSHCFPGQCYTYSNCQTIVREEIQGMKPGAKQNIYSEWVPKDKGECTVTYTIRVMELTSPNPITYAEKAKGPSVTVHYVYDDTSVDATGIGGVKAATSGNNAQPTYNLAGQRVAPSYKGLVVKGGKKRLVR